MQLGARVSSYARDPAGGEAAMDAAVVDASSSFSSSLSVSSSDPGGIDMLVVDGAALFASGGLCACLDGAWNATRAVFNLAFLPAGRGGRVVYLAPAPGADRSEVGQQADAARAGLENLARTVSVEWARHEITLVTIAVGDATAPGEAAALTAYLASPAGAYFSGCLLDLRGV
jgi:NAD(P)-dependent dehydrogenase (short-subunit alcohol dehydrogenase family)